MKALLRLYFLMKALLRLYFLIKALLRLYFLIKALLRLCIQACLRDAPGTYAEVILRLYQGSIKALFLDESSIAVSRPLKKKRGTLSLGVRER
jgi:hypothetical protein